MSNGREGVHSPSRPLRAQATIVIAGPPSLERIDLSRYLRDAGHRLLLVETPAHVITALEQQRPDVVIALGSSPAEMLEVCGVLPHRRIPLLIVYTEATSDAIVTTLDAGADDVVVAAISPTEFLARVAVAIRRSRALAMLPSVDVIELAGLRIDLVAQRAQLGRTFIDVPGDQLQLLLVLARNLGVVLSIEVLVEQLWPGEAAAGAARLRGCVTRLRKRLAGHPTAPAIVAERGGGYAMVLRPIEP